MSNAWFYQLLISTRPTLSAEKIGDTLKAAEAVGYFAQHPRTGQFWLTKVVGNDMKEFKLDDPVEVIELLGNFGGLLHLWKRETNDWSIDISLSFDPTGDDEARIIRVLHLQDTPTFGSISIVVDSTWFRPDASERWRVAQDLQKLFSHLCVKLESVYGYSVDEHTIEYFAHDFHLHSDARDRRKPSVLFWLNYFAAEHSVQIGGAGVFRQVGGKVIELPTGILVSFFEHPWEVGIAKLRAINERWRRLG